MHCHFPIIIFKPTKPSHGMRTYGELHHGERGCERHAESEMEKHPTGCAMDWTPFRTVGSQPTYWERVGRRLCQRRGAHAVEIDGDVRDSASPGARTWPVSRQSVMRT